MVLRFLFCCYQARDRRTRIRFGLFLPEFAQLLRQVVDRKLTSRSMSLINKKWHLFVAAKQKNWSAENHNPAIVVESEYGAQRRRGSAAPNRIFPAKMLSHFKNPSRTTHPPCPPNPPTPPSKSCFRVQFPLEKNSTWRMLLCYFRRSFLYMSSDGVSHLLGWREQATNLTSQDFLHQTFFCKKMNWKK